MQILSKLFGRELENFEKALGKSTQRANLLMGNLANVNTPGYKRRDMDFSLELDKSSEKFQLLEPRRHDLHDANESSIRVDGSNVDLEREIYALSETEMRYKMLTEMTSRYFSGIKNAIREGR